MCKQHTHTHTQHNHTLQKTNKQTNKQTKQQTKHNTTHTHPHRRTYTDQHLIAWQSLNGHDQKTLKGLIDLTRFHLLDEKLRELGRLGFAHLQLVEDHLIVFQIARVAHQMRKTLAKERSNLNTGFREIFIFEKTTSQLNAVSTSYTHTISNSPPNNNNNNHIRVLQPTPDTTTTTTTTKRSTNVFRSAVRFMATLNTDSKSEKS
jgi:hypothetical protein